MVARRPLLLLGEKKGTVVSLHTHVHTLSPHRDASGCINQVEARLNLENTDYKNTLKLTWLADTDHAPLTPTVCVHFEHLINKGVLKPDEDFKNFVNWNSKVGRKDCIVGNAATIVIIL